MADWDLNHMDGSVYIFPRDVNEIVHSADFYEVIPETVGQLRYEKDGVEYYDGDVYYHAGHGNEQVSDICNLQFALYVGESQKIEHIIGNIHDNPELLKS